jgi:predicted nuclease of predicted toxin-antitoxin system
MSKKKAVVDEDLPRIIDKILEELNWEVKDVRDVGLRGKSDEEIINFAQKSKAVLFSGDLGFANILKFPPKQYCGIVILNFPNEVSTNFIAAQTKKALLKIPFKNFKGKLIIIEPEKIRIR